MKIVGHSGERSWDELYIVEMSRSEIESLIGRSGPENYPGSHKRFAIGFEIKVIDAIQHAHDMVARRQEMLKAAAFMRAFADHIEKEVPTIVPVPPPPPPTRGALTPMQAAAMADLVIDENDEVVKSRDDTKAGCYLRIGPYEAKKTEAV